MVSLTNILKRCKDSQGGLKLVYLFTYKSYARSQIVTNDNVLTSFPQTIIYSFEFIGSHAFENKANEQDGGKYYTESLSLQFSRLGNSFELNKLLKQDLRVIIKDNNGKYRILGLYNGVTCSSVKADSGSSKSTFNGYTVTFDGMEINQSLYINNLQDAGFGIGVDLDFRITQDNEIRELQNNDLRITQNG